MNDETLPELAPRVRPRFRKLAIAAFVLLIPIALFALWDYIEEHPAAPITIAQGQSRPPK